MENKIAHLGTSDIHVSDIEKEDVLALWPILEEMHAEGDFRDIPIDYDKVNKILSLCVESDDFMCVIMRHEDRIIGFYIALITNEWFSNEPSAGELALYITPEYRSTGLAPILINRYLSWARKKNVKIISAGTTSNVNSEKTKRLYEGFGFNTIGFLFRLRNKLCADQ